MAVTAKWYSLAFSGAFNKEIDLDDGNIKIMLCGSAYTPDQDADDFIDDVSDEISGTGYTAGGASLAGASVLYDSANNWWYFDGEDTTWANSTLTAWQAIMYSNTGTASTSRVILYQDFGEAKSSSSGNFTLQWSASGIGRVTVS